MAIERRLTLADGKEITNEAQLYAVWKTLTTPNGDLSGALTGKTIRPSELVEITTPAAILEYRDSDSGPKSPWTVKGFVEFPTDLSIPNPPGEHFRDDVLFRFQSGSGPVFFRIGAPERLSIVELQIQAIASPLERSLLQQELREIIDSLKKRIIDYCNHHYRT